MEINNRGYNTLSEQKVNAPNTTNAYGVRQSVTQLSKNLDHQKETGGDVSR